VRDPLFRRYTVREDGAPVTQSTAPELVRTMVGAADLAPGQRVLEVGTGSGYSTAVLAQTVGPAGHVVSLDVNQALVERARALLRADGLGQVEVHCRDARTDLPDGGPFDCVIAWATSPAVPGVWLAATRDDGVLVLPVESPPYLVQRR
jgi:protein-L-isoaspartate(D-aspartate) O-methyltransferase